MRSIIVIFLLSCQADVTLGEATQIVCDSTCLRQKECGSLTSVQECSRDCVVALCDGYDCDAPLEGDGSVVLQCAWDVRVISCLPTRSPESCGELR